jgi:hypothetical protein
MVVDKQEAWSKLPAPLLNRFEKHILEPSHMLAQQFEPIVERLRELVHWLASAGMSSSATVTALRAAVCGHREETLPSLVLAVQASLASTAAGTAAASAAASSATADAMDVDTHSDDSDAQHRQQQQQQLWDKCVQALLWMCTPESVLRLQQAVSALGSSDRGLSELYFKQQAHATLNDALTALTVYYSSSGSSSSGSTGISVLVATHSALAPGLPHLTGYSAVTHIALHEVSQAADLEQALLQFFDPRTSSSSSSDSSGNSSRSASNSSGALPQLLLLQADVLSTTLRAVEHARYMVDQARTAAAVAAATATVATSQRHVCLLLHLPRDSELNSFSLAYSRRWQCAFVDCAAPVQGPSLPDVWSLVSTSSNTAGATAGAATAATDGATAMEVDSDASKQQQPPAAAAAAAVFDTLDKQRVLSLCVRPALSKLRYSSTATTASSSGSSDARTAQDVRAQIQLLLLLLANYNNSSSSSTQQSVFTAAMVRAVQCMLSRSDAPVWLSLDKQSLTAGALPDAALRLGGTLQGSLQLRLLQSVSALLAVALSHASRSASLELLAELSSSSSSDDESGSVQQLQCAQQLWASLFEESFVAMGVYERAVPALVAIGSSSSSTSNSENSSSSAALAVSSDGYGGSAYASRSPFSFYIVRVLDSVARHASSAAVLEQQFTALVPHSAPLLQQLLLLYTGHPDKVTRLLQSYLHDLVCMKLPPVAWMSREEQTAVVWQLLPTLSSSMRQQQQQQQRINSIPAVHYWFCTQQRALAQHCALISAAAPLYSPLRSDAPVAMMDTSDDPTATAATAGMTSCATAVEAAHLSLLTAVAQALLPSSDLWHGDSAVALWARTAAAALHAAPAVLSACTSKAAVSSQEYSTVRETWQQLALTLQFMTDVAAPLQLPTESVLAAAARLCESGVLVQSCAGLERVVQALMAVKRSSSSDAQVHACIAR